jgi:predicted esterase
MLRLNALLGLVLVALASSSFAQEKEDYIALNRKAIEAMHAKKFDDGIAILTRMLDVGPKDQRKGTAYNFACLYALKGDTEKAFEWLDKSIEWGWGSGRSTLDGSDKVLSEVDMAKTDPDFESLRKDPRFAKRIENLERAGAARALALMKGEEYAKTAAIYVPEKVAAQKEMPILVVLHDEGSTKDQIVQGRWKAIADELGCALIAPSGKFPVGDDPAKGMAWYESIGEYPARYDVYDGPVHAAVSAFRKEHGIDKDKVVVVGEGVGGIVALSVAISEPGIYRGAVALNTPLFPQLYAAKAPAAGKFGLRVALLVDASKATKESAPDGVEKLVEAQNKSLKSWGLGGESKAFTPDPKDVGERKLLVQAIRNVLAKPAAAPASAPAPETPKK